MLTSVRDLVEMAVLGVLVGTASWTVWRLQSNRGVRTYLRVLIGFLSLGIGVALCLLPQRAHAGVQRVGFPLPLWVFQSNGSGAADKVSSPLGTRVAGLLNVVLVSGVIHRVTRLVLASSRRRGSASANV